MTDDRRRKLHRSPVIRQQTLKMLKIYHNSRCKKSRNGLNYLQDKGLEFEIVEYLKIGLTEEDVKDFIAKSGLSPMELVRTQEDYYKKEMKGKDLSDAKIITEIAANPKLLQRPLVENKGKMVFAQSEDKIDEIL